MAILKNLTREKLARGATAIGLGVRQARSVEIGMVAAAAGFDWIMLDREHSAMDMDTAANLATAALTQGVTPFVRSPGPEAFHVIPLLDAGLQGIIVPHIDTAEEARALVREFRFPPLGHRSMLRSSPASAYAAIPIAEFARGANEALLIAPMLESPRAIANADEIAAVEGIDILLIGASDLCADMDLYDQFDHPAIEQAFRDVAAACAKHGKVMGMGGISGDALLARYMGLGARFVIGGSDGPMLLAAGRSLTARLRRIEETARTG